MKKVLVCILSLAMVFSFLPSNAFADEVTNPTKKITFTYYSDSNKATCYYSNEYFADSSYTYNPSLATMSVSFALTAGGSSTGGQTDYTNKSAYAKQLLMDIGVSESAIKTNSWFTKKPTTDSIGAIVGSMPINVGGEDSTLIALAIRGGGYEAEWASNLTIGSTGAHQGFDEAKDEVIEFLKEYIDEQGITGNVKLWITGYSRAGAVANLIGGAIDDSTLLSTNISYDLDDVYTYCLEAPAGALTSSVKDAKKYNNIFNIINSSDPTPYAAPTSMGFCRYGVDYYLPSKESDPDTYASLKEKMLKIYNSLPNTGDYTVDDFQMKKINLDNYSVEDDTDNNYSQGFFLSTYINIISKDFVKTRDNYVENYQDEVRELCKILFGFTSKQTSQVVDSFIAQAEDGIGDLVISYIWNTQIDPYGSEEDAFQLISDWLKKAISDAGITDYDEDAIDSAGKKLTSFLLDLVMSQPNYFVTTVANLKGIAAAHYAELCYAWLASMDENYEEGASAQLNNGAYRIFFLDCDADVEVTDNDGEVVASIQNGTPDLDDESGYIYGIDDDGQIYIVLPIDENYSVKITGREDGEVNYTITEYSASSENYTRNVCYSGVDLEDGEVLTGEIPSYSEYEIATDAQGSDAVYTLYDADHNIIESDHDKSGADAANDMFEINVTSSDAKKGVAIGSGFQLYGTFAQIEASPKEGYSFVGWYKDGALVSTDATYRFCVTEDVKLVAEFKENEVDGDTPTDGGNASNESEQSNANTSNDSTNQSNSSNTQTGDNSNVWLWVVMLVIFGTLGFCVISGVSESRLLANTKKRKKK